MNKDAERGRCVDFHPTSTVGLVGSRTGKVVLMQIDGKYNPKIQTLSFKTFNTGTVKFSTDGKEVIVGCRNEKAFHVFDMIAGKMQKVNMETQTFGVQDSAGFELSPDGKLIAIKGHTGSIQIYSANTKEYIANLQMNDNCQALAFSKSGSKLYTYGDGGEFYVWDMNSRTCESKLVDDGCIRGNSLAVNSNYLACGSQEGVVNIYSHNKLSGMKTGYPKPDKTILNITSAITHLKFNPTGEILAISSEYKDNSVKLLHFPSMTIFENEIASPRETWKCNGVQFSPGSGYMGFGTNVGQGLLYRLQHYKDY
jgi:U3 small nucleolar RNA-associated protein 18